MTPQSLSGILKFVIALDDQLRLQVNLEAILSTLSDLVQSPADPTHQKALAKHLKTFSESASKLADVITPSRADQISEMGGSEFFDPNISDRVKESIQSNAMTPSVARDFVQDLSSSRSSFLAIVRSTADGLARLGIKGEDLRPGAADIAFLIPRELFDNSLSAFAKELAFISRLVQDVSEGILGDAKPVKLQTLSSSVPTISLDAAVETIKVLATVVAAFLAAWERIEKIRKTRKDLLDLGMRGKAVEELEEKITTTVDEVVEVSTQEVIAKYTAETGRKNELANAVRQDFRRLFGQIERGLTVEFRAAPGNDAADEEVGAALRTITDLGRTIHFPQPNPEPLLLSATELLEGEIRIQSTKTTRKTHKSTTATTSKKESANDDN